VSEIDLDAAALKGDIDISHFGFLHAGHVDPDDLPEDHPIRHQSSRRQISKRNETIQA